jgi:hypothetical protein
VSSFADSLRATVRFWWRSRTPCELKGLPVLVEQTVGVCDCRTERGVEQATLNVATAAAFP